MKVIAVVNQKGGVGKTTTVAALAAALKERGRFVALLDTDPQGALSLLAPGVEQVGPRDLPRKLRRLAGSDYVLIDTPPALGEAVTIAAELADGVIIPTLAEFLALRGLGNLLAAIEEAQILGLVITAYRGHVKHHRAVLEKIKELGYPILAVVPFSISASDAGLTGRQIASYSPAKSRGVAAAYRKLAEGIEKWRKRD